MNEKLEEIVQKLTKAQREDLEWVASRVTCISIESNTRRSLRKRGLVEQYSNRTFRTYDRITPDGRAALAEKEGKSLPNSP